MSLAELLLSLKPKLAAHEQHWDEIIEMLQKHRSLAEYEVARYYVMDTIGFDARQKANDIDPKERRKAVEMIRMVFPRSQAASILRHLVKDPDGTVRGAARAAVRYLKLSDVALPDSRFKLRPRMRVVSTTIGAWNPTGWSYGIYKPRRYQPTRPARLAKNQLPKISDVDALASMLGEKDEAALRRYMRPGTRTGSAYVEFEIEKATGGSRRIAAPRPSLKKVQRTILDQILAKVPTHEACHGFVSGRSIVTNAQPHQKAELVLKMDISDFFPSIYHGRVAGLFQYLGYAREVSWTLASLTTYRPQLPSGRVIWPGVLPQGAPTSPAIANLVAGRMDARLEGLANRAGAKYTRYADDLTFSFQKRPESKVGRFLWWVDQILVQEGFRENLKKRRILRGSNQLRVTGIVVNSGLFVPRADRRRFRAILHNCKKHGVASQARDRSDFEAYLRGFASYVKMVQPELGARLLREVEEVLS